MPGRRDEHGWWYFDTVQEFWETGGLEGEITWVDRDGFQGQLAKGLLGSEGLRPSMVEDRQEGHSYDVIIVEQLHNPCRSGNYYYSDNPPRRTGKFSEFMDELEAVAVELGIQFVWVEKVFNTFLPSKLERRGYRRIDTVYLPDYVKTFPGSG